MTKKKFCIFNTNLCVSIIITLLFLTFCVFFYSLKANEYSADAFENKADYFFYNEEYLNALKYYKKIISMGKISNKNYINLAVSAIKIENYKMAIKYLKLLLKNRDDLPESYYLLAYANYYRLDKEERNENNIKSVIDYLQKSIELNERYKPAYSLLGKIYEESEQYEHARTWYRKALFSDIENAEEFYGFIANTYFKEFRFDDAIKYYKKAIDKNKNYISAYCSIADIYTLQKDYDKAEKMYKQVINKDKEYILPYYKIGNLYYEQGNYTEAIKWYEQALEINKDNESVNYYIGMCYKKLNDLSQALKYLKIAAYCGSDEAVDELRTMLELF